MQALNNNFHEAVAYPDALRRSENITFDAEYEPTRGVALGAGAGVRLMRNLGAGVVGTWFRRAGAASFDLAVPNSIVANRPLTLTGDVPDLNRQEIGIHVQALYALPIGRRTRVIMSGGPSLFRVEQDVVTSIEFDRVPGFTGLEFHEAIVTPLEKTAIGFNVGADITWELWRWLGVGSLTRYTRAAVAFDPGHGAAGLSRRIELHVGGLEIGGGVRVRF